MNSNEIRLAFASDDGERISRQTGKSRYFVVARLTPDGSVLMERRSRGLSSGNNPHQSGLIQFQDGPAPGFNRQVSSAMFAEISDCQVLIASSMGQAAYDHAVSQGMQVLLSSEKNIQKAVEAYQAGSLESNPRRIHHHKTSLHKTTSKPTQ